MKRTVRYFVGFVVGLSLLGSPSSVRGQGTAAARLVQEDERQLSIMRSTHYQHKTDVDEGAGRFDYDCSGFLDYVLRSVAPDAYKELPVSKPSAKRPLAQDFYALFSGLAQPSGSWSTVPKASELEPGDIVSWLRPPDNDSNNTGHVMLVRAKPSRNPQESDELLVPVIDSTSSPHAADSRAKGQTGLGSGTIGLIVDAAGRAVSYRWRGGLSRREEITPIALGRLR